MERIGGWILLALLASHQGWASGSYVFRGSQPAAGRLAGADRYERGKAIYTGKARLEPANDDRRGRQAARLATLEDQLPARAKQNLRTLAGRLSDDQLASLEHYLKVRYKVR